MFNESCNELRNPEFCTDLQTRSLVIWSVVNAENTLMDNYQLCLMILGVALLFGIIIETRRKALFSLTRSIAPSSPPRRADTITHTAVGANITYTSAAGARAMEKSQAAHKFIIDAAKPGIVYFLSPSKCCSICLGRLAVDFEISETEMDLLVEAAQRKLGFKVNPKCLEDYNGGESEGVIIDQKSLEEDEDTDMAFSDKRGSKRDRKLSVSSDIELCVAEFAHRKKSISEPFAAETEGAELEEEGAFSTKGKHSPSGDADSRLMDVASFVVELPCHHVFHLRCIRAWLDAKLWNVSCPECRAPIVSEESLASADLFI
jgi:hypothetical protein